MRSIPWTRVRERGGGLLFALGLNALLLLAMLTLAPYPEPKVGDPRHPVSFTLAPEAKKEKTKAHKKEERREERREEKSAEQRPVEPVKPDKLPEPVQKPIVELPSRLPFLAMDREQMASADIGKMSKNDAAGAGSGSGDSAAVSGPGEGPGGVQLFDAEWYRRPSHAELATYLPGNAPAEGWGLVACKTVEDFRVENCQALGESPLGSGFARAVRLASWQFLVRPPRVNGKVMIGSWVRIRIDYRRTVQGGGSADS